MYTEAEIDGLTKRTEGEKLRSLKKDLEDLFAAPPESVITKEYPAPGGDPGDYVSLATYYWRDENSGTYIRRDGYVNPEGEKYDKDKLKRLAYLVYHGILLYFLSKENRYLDLVKKHLYNWFINKPTRMNPHLEYGQFIPGVINGRPEGIIDYAASFSYALNMLNILRQKGLLEEALLTGLGEWHRSFRDWLLESKTGKAEGRAENNHGTYYDITLLSIEQFLGLDDCIASRKDCFARRLKEQIAADYSLPHETSRSRSLSYTIMGLKGLLEEARFLYFHGIDFYPCLKNSVDWFYTKGIVQKESWPYPQVTPFDEGAFLLFRELITGIYGPGYEDIAGYVDPEKVLNKITFYLYY
jgi:hypothetical protein